MLAYTDDYNRQEKLNGVVVMMSPRPAMRHINIAGNIYRIFSTFLRGKRCKAYPDGTPIHLDDDNTVIPDASIVCNRDIIKHNGIYGTPDLIVEVLSPSTAKNDKVYKKSLYEKYGVKEYWIVEPAAKAIEVYLLADTGRLELDNIYTIFEDWYWEEMTEEERATAQLNFKVSLYDDLTIDIREVFEDID